MNLSRFLLMLCWVAGCFWLFTRIGFALQVIDRAEVLVDKQQCTQATESCVVIAQAEGQFDHSWLVTVKSTGETFQVTDSVLNTVNFEKYAYRPSAWTMAGLLAGFGVSAMLGSYVIINGRFRRKPSRPLIR